MMFVFPDDPERKPVEKRLPGKRDGWTDDGVIEGRTDSLTSLTSD